MHRKTYIQLLKEQTTGNFKTICIYYDKGIQQFNSFKKENQKFDV